MKVEFFEKQVEGKIKTVTKLHIKKVMQEEVTKIIPEDSITRPATEQDKTEFKEELANFLTKKKKKK